MSLSIHRVKENIVFFRGVKKHFNFKFLTHILKYILYFSYFSLQTHNKKLYFGPSIKDITNLILFVYILTKENNIKTDNI